MNQINEEYELESDEWYTFLDDMETIDPFLMIVKDRLTGERYPELFKTHFEEIANYLTIVYSYCIGENSYRGSITLDWSRLSKHRFELKLLSLAPVGGPGVIIRHEYKELRREINRLYPETKATETAPAGDASLQATQLIQRQGGPTVKTQERFAIFKRHKEAHPSWSYYTVAMKSTGELEDPNITGETVRNVYRLMGKPWPRADKIK
jgi:hypothetical protein